MIKKIIKDYIKSKKKFEEIKYLAVEKICLENKNKNIKLD